MQFRGAKQLTIKFRVLLHKTKLSIKFRVLLFENLSELRVTRIKSNLSRSYSSQSELKRGKIVRAKALAKLSQVI